MTSIELNNASIAVFGTGKTGLSCVEYLHRRAKSLVVFEEIRGSLRGEIESIIGGSRIVTGPLSSDWISDIDLIVTSPGVPLENENLQRAKSGGVRIIGDVELFAQANSKKVIAVTGTNGKSTVVTLINEILNSAGIESHIGGNIGIPVLDLLEYRDADYFVIELSSFQLDTTTSLHVDIGVILNITEDHMNRYIDFSAYAASKMHLTDLADHSVLNAGDQLLANKGKASKLTFYGGAEDRENGELALRAKGGQTYVVRNDRELISATEVKMQGLQNLENLLAAWTVATLLDIPDDVVSSVAASFAGLAHRMETVSDLRGMTWINDSKATNVGAATAAITGLDRGIIWIAGGEGKSADFTPLGPAVAGRVKLAILIGSDANEIASVVQNWTDVLHADTLLNAVQKAADLGSPGDVVLLSPACASFDMFKSFEDRGEKFVAAIEQVATAYG